MPADIEFDLARTDIAGHPMLMVYGELDVVSSPKLYEAIGQILEEKPSVLLIDLANVTFMDSSGLGALVVAHRHFEESEGELRLVAVPESVARVFQLAGLTDMFSAYANVALASE